MMDAESSAPKEKSFQAKFSQAAWTECPYCTWAQKLSVGPAIGLDPPVSGRSWSLFTAILEESFRFRPEKSLLGTKRSHQARNSK